MNLKEIIELVNSKQKTVPQITDMLGCSRDLLKSILKENGYSYDQKKKIYIHSGEGEITDFSLIPIIKERQERQTKRRNKSDNSQNKIRKESDKNKQESDLYLTEEEIKFVKNLMKGKTEWEREFELNYSFSNLPGKKPSKKATYEISKETYDKFERFSEVIGEKHRMSKNDLIEIALVRMMDDFN